MSFSSSELQTRFERCRQLLAKVQPQEAFFLSFPNQTISFSVTPRTIEEGNLDKVDLLYVYGVEDFSCYYAVQNWLLEDTDRHIVFLEDSQEILAQFFLQKEALEILQDPQVSVYLLKNSANIGKDLDALFWDFPLKQMAFFCSPSKKKEVFEELKSAVMYEAAVKNAGIEEYLEYGIPFFQNYYYNLLQIARSYDGAAHFSKYEGIPAILCGAGPSLEKNAESLRLLADKAVIFGGGSALNALSSRGIFPHFGIGVDPNSAQKIRLESNLAYEVPVFYRNRMHREAFSLIHGPRLYIRGSGGYDVADWVDQQLGLSGDWIDEGHNVVNFGLELAYRMGCNPIILVGVDLAYTDLQAYARGVEKEIAVAIEKITHTGDFDTDAIERRDIYGKPIYTLWKWIAESVWISEFAKSHRDVLILNATEGGIGMEGIENLSLQEVERTYLQRSYDISGLVFSHIVPHRLAVTEQKVLSVVQELERSFSRCQEHLAILVEENRMLQNTLSRTKEVPKPLQSGRGALAEIELNEEIAYEYVLDLFHIVYAKLMNRKVHTLQEEKEKLEGWEYERRKAQLAEQKLVFLQKVAAANKKIIEDAKTKRQRA